MVDNNKDLASRAALVVGACCVIWLLTFIVASHEGRRRIAREIGVNNRIASPFEGDKFRAGMQWQIRNVSILLLVFLGSAVGLILGIVGWWRTRSQTRMAATAGIWLNVVGLVVAAFFLWGIS